MKIDDAYKRKIYGQWLRKTGRGYKRKSTALTVKAREYMKAKPYCGAFNRTDCFDRDPDGEKPIENTENEYGDKRIENIVNGGEGTA